MTKRLTRFLGDIEHFDPTFQYRPGPLQIVPDAAVTMPGLQEEGEPADTQQFTAIENEPAAEQPQNTPEPDSPSKPRRFRKSEYYRRLRKYLKASHIVEDPDNELKDYASGYELRSDGKVYNLELNTPVIETVEDLIEVIGFVHKDLGHYGKRTTLDGVRERYEVASNLWEEGGKMLDSCIPCQLNMDAPEDKTPPIHPYGAQKPFALWEIDFVGKVVKTPRGMEYLITAIEYCTSKAIAYPLEKRSAQAAIEVLEEIIWVYGKPQKLSQTMGKNSDQKNSKLWRNDTALMLSTPVQVIHRRTGKSNDSTTS